MLGEVERFPGSKECMVWYFYFKPLSPFSLMKYYTMLGSRGSQQTMNPEKEDSRLQMKKENSQNMKRSFL
jgi:hypothetical protein